MLSLDLTGCQCQSRKSAKGRHIIVFRSDGLPLYGTESGLELLIPEEYQGPWLDSFEALPGSNPSNGHPKPAPDPPKPRILARKDSVVDSLTKDRTQVLSEMVKSYMEIVHKTVMDVTPKYIILSLVQAVSIFYNTL